MAQELKVRITDYKSVEEKLKNLGAVFLEEKTFVDTYFKQPKGHVMKIDEENRTAFLIEFRENDGKFDLARKESLKDHKKAKQELLSQYGLKRILKGRRKNYRLDDFTITLNLIDNVGEFLIVTGENPTKKFITQRLTIGNPEYITVSFDELKMYDKRR